MHNPLTSTYSQHRFNRGKLDGFAEACELVERHSCLTRDIISILIVWKYFVEENLFTRTFYSLGRIVGIKLAYLYFGGQLHNLPRLRHNYRLGLPKSNQGV